jgi:hypothetical protein
MAWPMIEWVLDNYYADRFNQQPSAEAAILVWQGIESALTPLMLRIEAEYPGVKVFSLPFLGSAEVQRHIELGVRGVPEQVPPAMQMLRRGWQSSAAAFATATRRWWPMQERSLEFEEAGSVDALTGIHNRRWLQEAFPRAMARCERDQNPLCLILADIDLFP